MKIPFLKLLFINAKYTYVPILSKKCYHISIYKSIIDLYLQEPNNLGNFYWTEINSIWILTFICAIFNDVILIHAYSVLEDNYINKVVFNILSAQLFYIDRDAK